MNYETFNIFPTTIYLGEIDNHKKYKEDFYKVYDKFDYDDQNTPQPAKIALPSVGGAGQYGAAKYGSSLYDASGVPLVRNQ